MAPMAPEVVLMTSGEWTRSGEGPWTCLLSEFEGNFEGDFPKNFTPNF